MNKSGNDTICVGCAGVTVRAKPTPTTSQQKHLFNHSQEDNNTGTIQGMYLPLEKLLTK